MWILVKSLISSLALKTAANSTVNSGEINLVAQRGHPTSNTFPIFTPRNSFWLRFPLFIFMDFKFHTVAAFVCMRNEIPDKL